MQSAVLCFLLLCVGVSASSHQVDSSISAVEALLRRVIPDDAHKFRLATLPASEKDVFEFSASDGVATVSGSSGVALASGVYWYLKYYCNCQVTWGVNGTGDNLKVPNPLPDAPRQRRQSPVEFRYSWNVCTFGYTATFWDWHRWEQEIDWMALHGVNFPLAFTGQEYIWAKTFESFGLDISELYPFFSGPAFLPWQRMGNMRGWGGPLPWDWMVEQATLQKRILGRMREYGMKPILPCFAGHVPDALTRVFPHANLTRSARWGRFDNQYCCDYILEPTDDLYKTIGKKFLEIQQQEYGTDHYYNCDMYNEMNPPSSNANYLHEASKAVIDGIQTADKEGKWVMQGWLFHSGFWSYDNTKAYLGGVPDSDMIILDLNSEAGVLAFRYDNYFGKSWIWNMLHNYGGRRGVYGNLTRIATGPIEDKKRAGKGMVGVGFTPEAIEQNPVMYEMLMEMGWRDRSPNVGTWVQQYAKQRYGGSTQFTRAAWKGFYDTVYSQPGEALARPSYHPSCSMEGEPFDMTNFVSAWGYLVKAAGELTPNGPFNYDLVDVTSQAVASLFDDVLNMLCWEYKEYSEGKKSNTEALKVIGNLAAYMDAMITSLDDLYASDINYLLGVWMQKAAYKAHNNDTLWREYIFNAKNQITLWGPQGNINDYAAKSWQGLMGDYNLQRWTMWLDAMYNAVQANVKFDQPKIDAEILKFGMQWDASNKTFISKPRGSPVTVAKRLLHDYTTMPANFKKVAHTDSPGDDIVSKAAWSKNIAELAVLCNMNPNCKGFNSDGWLKENVDDHRVGSKADLYVKIE